MWMMLQQDSPGDYVIATGETHSVREFVKAAFAAAGIDNWESHIVQDPRYMRPADVPLLRGRADKAARAFGWKPKTRFDELVTLMVREDIARVQRDVGGGKISDKLEQLQRRIEKLERRDRESRRDHGS
jgi:GDPmannose 4,6-dehydratase